MAGRTIGNSSNFNSLQAGMLPIHESQNPVDQRYQSGLELAGGISFSRGRVSKFVGVENVSPHVFPADYVPYPDAEFYKRNTSNGSVSTFTTIPSDDIIGASESLGSRLERIISEGNPLSRPRVASSALVVGTIYRITFVGTSNWNAVGYVGTPAIGGLFTATGTITGDGLAMQADLASVNQYGDKTFFLPSSPYTGSQSKLLAANETSAVNINLKYARAVSYNSGDGIRWGVIGKVKFYVRKTEQYYLSALPRTLVGNYTIGWNDRSVQDIEEYIGYTICNGSGKKIISTYYTDLSGGTLSSGATERVKWEMFVEVSVVIETVKSGSIIKNGLLDLYLVGRGDMLNIAGLEPRSFSYKSSYGDKRTATTDRLTDSFESLSDASSIYILRWASAGEDQGFSDVDTPALQAVGASTAFSYTNVATTGSTQFFFSFARNKISYGRRVGIARLKSTQNLGIPQDSGIGFAQQNNGAISTIAIPATTETEPYFVILDSSPVWVEVGYKGVFCGTEYGEYLISNEALAKSYSVQRISSIGATDSPASLDYCDSSTLINGTIYFLTKTGVAHLQFSTEAQTYIPSKVNLEEYGYSGPSSISSSRKYNCLFVSFKNGSTACIFLDTGAISYFTPMNKSDSTGDLVYVGTRTENGEPVFVFRSQTAYKMAGLSSNFLTSRIRTTKFFSGPERVAKINKVYLYLSESFGGRVRVTGNDDWISIPYEPDEIAAKLFTGVKEISVYDTVGPHGTGKSIEIEFAPDEPMNIVGVSVGGDS